MRHIFQQFTLIVLLAFGGSLCAQQPTPPSSPSPPATPSPAPAPAPTTPAPAPAPAPSTATPSPSPSGGNPAAVAPAASSGKTDIPVISIGDQVKPMGAEKEKPANNNGNLRPKKTVRKTTPVQKTAKVETNAPLLLECRQLVHSRLSQIGDEVVFVVAENYPSKGASLLPKGTIVVGKISAMQRMEKNQPAGIRVSLDSVFSPTGSAIPINGTWEMVRQKGQDNWGGKEAFIPVGTRQIANLTKKFSSRIAARPLKTKAVKGQLSALAEIEGGLVTIKLGDLKYPTRVEAIIEGPQGIEVTNLKEDSIKIVRVNDFTLPHPIAPLDEKIKVADRNKNGVKDISYRFPGWDLIRYLPEGNSTVVLSAQTKDGKPVEIIATVKTEYK